MATPDRRRRARTAGLLGAVVGVAAAGVAGGIAVQKLLVRKEKAGPDPYRDEPFDALPYDTETTVTTDGGVDLHVEVVEAPGRRKRSAPTVVLVHGYALDMGTFHFQRRALTEAGYRVVAYDQPGHGRSARAADGGYSIQALGSALWRVIEQVAPDGPLVLVGHSMGAMTIMALAEQHPQLFGRRGRVRAVALISTSAGKLSEVPLGLPNVLPRARARLLPVLAGAAKLTPGVIDRARGAATDVAYLLTRRYGFGGASPSPAVVAYVERMNERTSIEVIAGYLETLFTHSRYAVLSVLADTDVLVVAGDKDLFTPLAHAEEIARLLPTAELLVVPDSGHMALLEYPDVVNQALLALVERAGRKR
ncbi:alpha/beta fold hydrolase [Actinocatenispora rupis]|uniref:Lipase n=1 Tax=Actinocatenispora rupis TaxID=519421 RepID=A0A8J3J7M5_9ACTN|nr:alpha/beta hydrolase [Actinocatenispora rupis]GID11637.1 lipase [Actinocatenispora rupis]